VSAKDRLLATMLGGGFARDAPSRKADHGDWATAAVRVALLGDSTLDNVLWIQDGRSVSELLTAALPSGAVCNLAADGFNSADLLRGSEVVLSEGLRESIGDPVPWSEDSTFRPLVQLAALSPPPTHVVLSIGGNDVREILGNMRRLPEIMGGFAQNYPAIVEACRKVTPNVILMWQYRPSLDMDQCYGVYRAMSTLPGPESAEEKLNGLMETIYAPQLEMAKQLRLPIVDLPRTFDIRNEDLYVSQIEPSEKGGMVISALLSHVVLNRDFTKDPSKFYLYTPCIPGEGEVVEEDNGEEPWRIRNGIVKP